jgi:hypothetical protein
MLKTLSGQSHEKIEEDIISWLGTKKITN